MLNSSTMLDSEVVIYIIIMISVMMITIATNITTLCVMAFTDYLRNINRVYLYSMTISDLCTGLFVCPFAMYCLITNVFSIRQVEPKLCHVQAYLFVMLILSGLYAISWMNVDHYVAVRKPERYKVMMSPTRSLCWISFAWIAAISFCLPPLLSFQDTRYYGEVFICTLFIGSEIAYFVTAGVLALMPPFLVLLITDVYLFTHGFKKKQKMYEAVLLEVSSRPKNYHINSLVSVVIIVTWMPWIVIRIFSVYFEGIPQALHFVTFWIAMGNGFYKFFLYVGMSLEYRRGLRDLLNNCWSSIKCACCERLPQQQSNNIMMSTRLVSKPSTSGPPPAVL